MVGMNLPRKNWLVWMKLKTRFAQLRRKNRRLLRLYFYMEYSRNWTEKKKKKRRKLFGSSSTTWSAELTPLFLF